MHGLLDAVELLKIAVLRIARGISHRLFVFPLLLPAFQAQTDLQHIPSSSLPTAQSSYLSAAVALKTVVLNLVILITLCFEFLISYVALFTGSI